MTTLHIFKSLSSVFFCFFGDVRIVDSALETGRNAFRVFLVLCSQGSTWDDIYVYIERKDVPDMCVDCEDFRREKVGEFPWSASCFKYDLHQEITPLSCHFDIDFWG